jgi:hypothetical protein
MSLAALSVAGCENPIGPWRRERAQARGASLWVTVTFADSGLLPVPPQGPGPVPSTARVAGIAVDAYLDPGALADGRARAVANDTLRVAGVAVPALRRGTGGAGGSSPAPELPPYSYSARVPLSASAFGQRAVAVENAPTVEGVTSASFPDPLFGVGRGGPDTLTVAAGEDIVLPLALPSGAPPPLGPPQPGTPSTASWSLLVRSAANPALPALVALGGPGRPPAAVRVSTSLLPPLPTPGPLVLELTTRQAYYTGYSADPRTPGYVVSLDVGSRLRWFVRPPR